MAKSKREAESELDEQMTLIDVDTPEMKEVKKELTQYEKLKMENAEQHAADREAEKDKRLRVLAAIEASGATPNADGEYHFRVGDKEWVISQDSQLKIKKHKIKGEGGEDEGGLLGDD